MTKCSTTKDAKHTKEEIQSTLVNKSWLTMRKAPKLVTSNKG